MRLLLCVLSLVLSASCARASERLYLPVDSPFVDLNPQDTTCWTIEELTQINDSLWSGVEHRGNVKKAVVIIAQYEAELKASQRREDMAKKSAAIAVGDNSALVTAADQYKKDAEFWKGKSKGRGWRGFGMGILVAVGSYFSIQHFTR